MAFFISCQNKLLGAIFNIPVREVTPDVKMMYTFFVKSDVPFVSGHGCLHLSSSSFRLQRQASTPEATKEADERVNPNVYTNCWFS